MSNYYDDNFGHWDMEEDGMEEFYRAVNAQTSKRSAPCAAAL